MGSWLAGTLRRLALALPLSRASKMRMATLAFKIAGPLFRGDPAYDRYIASKRLPSLNLDSNLRQGSPEALIAQAINEGFDLRTKEKPRVRVFIPSFGQFHHTLACLRSIDKHRAKVVFEVLVVDDASNETAMAMLGLLPGVGFRANTFNLGFLQSCNDAVQGCDTEFIYLLNNDTEVCQGWLDALVELMDRHQDCGVVGSKLISSDGRLQEAGGILWQDASAWNWGRGDEASRYLYNFVRETDYVSGASMLIRTKLWEQLKGFDTRYAPAYCEDSDFAFRARSHGSRVYDQPFSCVVHHEGLSHGTDLNQGGKSYQIVNQKRFLERWRPVLEKDHFPNGQHVYLARGRTQSKNHILFLDHYVPQPDRDAGSRTVSEFIKAIQAIGSHVTFWPHNGWYDPDYTPLLQSLGVEVVYGDDAARGLEIWLDQNAAYLNAVVLSRPDVFEAFEPVLRRFSVQPIIYYGHDIHFARMQMQKELQPDSHMTSSIERMRQREMDIWRRADIVLYPSNEEANLVIQQLKSSGSTDSFDVHKAKAPNKAMAIQPYVFEQNKAPPALERRKILIFVAGFAHPPNEDAADWLVHKIMPKVWSVFPSLTLALVGSNPTDKVKCLAKSSVQVTGYVTDRELAELYNQALVALVPLRFGAGVKNKVIEALAQGVPLVTTPIGMQGLEQADDVAKVAEHPEEFAKSVVDLLSHPKSWYEQQKKGFDYANRFSAQAMQAAWQRLLR